MICIYGKGKVGNALKAFCDGHSMESEVVDDADNVVDFSRYSAIIPSPGIAPSHRIYATGKIVGELDFVSPFLPKGFKILAVTGTDGKSTTAWILYELLRQEYGEDSVFLSGNFDVPFAETVRMIGERGLKKGYIVIEVSSFMAYNIRKFHSTHSIFTNFETDHLNWHPNLQDYFDAKMRLFQHTTGTSVINAQVLAKAKELGLVIPSDIPNVRIFGRDDTLSDRTDGEDIIISGRRKYHLSETNFSGIHNAMNILSSTIVTNTLKICSKRTREYLRNISGLSHRLEFVIEKNGVRFVDDSKSTSAQSLIAALGSFPTGKVILIAGGSDKGDTFEGVAEAMRGVVKHAELIGATREKLGEVCKKAGVDFYYAESMDEAVRDAFVKASPGDTILLSPGCASFGMFRDYLDRAEKFR
ncbi:MAG: UDP-N-acetylmuramoyl-L-alanine--D-glutamate ligase, partial [Candidatus Gracilibacteria bacterium]|nr:UDP-N-acetylmuramoyl-L-alanine--D-glutamate ligase [Candidatus Gracilibacteria bacterium]